MSSKSTAAALSDILKYIADKIERNPELVENFKIEIKIKPEKRVEKATGLSDYDTEDDMFNALKKKNMEQLKSIIRENKLGKTASIAKFKTKEELIKYIIKRVNDRYHKGDSFGRVSPEKVS